MSIDKVSAARTYDRLGAHRRDGEALFQKSLSRAEVGDVVSVRVTEKIGERRFAASVGDASYIVASQLPLRVGQIVKAAVSSVGGIVELKYIDVGQFEQEGSIQGCDEPQMHGGGILSALQSKYGIFLPMDARSIVIALMDQADHPEAMIGGALYLARLGETVSEESVRALYAKQIWPDEGRENSGVLADITALIRGAREGGASEIEALANKLLDAVEDAASGEQLSTAASPMGGSAVGGGSASDFEKHDQGAKDGMPNALSQLAKELLNRQDSGALSYHYGSLPVIVADQLVELDLVVLRERQSTMKPTGMRKLVMTLRTETLGKVEVIAQSMDGHLGVSIGVQSESAADSLSTHTKEVCDLLGRLGWSVDGVSYRIVAEPARAADFIIKHVLAAGSLDAVV